MSPQRKPRGPASSWRSRPRAWAAPGSGSWPPRGRPGGSRAGRRSWCQPLRKGIIYIRKLLID